MRIRDVDNPETFQRFVRAVFVAEFGDDFHVVDDSGGDSGNDGYRPSDATMFAVYCPEKLPVDPSRLRTKIQSDLAKAKALVATGRYAIKRWVFVTPQDLREPVHQFVRDQALAQGLEGSCLGETHLRDLFLRHEYLHSEFVELASFRLVEDMAKIRAGLERVEEALKDSHTSDTVELEVEAEPSVMLRSSPSARLIDLQRKLLDGEGNAEALGALETIRLETTDHRESLWATLIALQWVDKVTGHDKLIAMIDPAINLADGLGEHGAKATLLAEKGWLRNWQYVQLDIETYYRLHAERTIGIAMTTPLEVERNAERIKRLESESWQLFTTARDLANSKRCYRELSYVLQKWGSALAQRIMFQQNVSHLAGQVASNSAEMRKYYETAIRIAAALSDLYALASAYHNYANELFSIGALGDAAQIAARSRELAEKLEWRELREKGRDLAARIARAQ